MMDKPTEAIEILRGPYRQFDEDGVIVGVSRQAIYETLVYLDALEARPSRWNEAIEAAAKVADQRASINYSLHNPRGQQAAELIATAIRNLKEQADAE